MFRINKNWFGIIGIALLAFAMQPKKNIKLFMAGDSTMSIKEVRTYPENGWGMPFAIFFDSSVTVINRAKNGRSTSSFQTEGLWKSITDELSEGDYVFIQFGHNDEVPTKKTATTPEVFKSNLLKFINDTKAKKGIPVLLTSVARRSFDSTGKVISTHEQYANITREVAKETGVLFIDMDKQSRELLQQLGVKESQYLYNHLKPGEHPNYPDGKEDNTHFSELGAREMAQMALAAIRVQIPELASRIYTPVKK